MIRKFTGTLSLQEFVKRSSIEETGNCPKLPISYIILYASILPFIPEKRKKKQRLVKGKHSSHG
jgi:hypothetical protein